MKSLSPVRLFATPWTVAHQAPPSMEFSRQEYWSGLPFPSPGDLPNPGIKLESPASQADTLPSGPPGNPLRRPCLFFSLVQSFSLVRLFCDPMDCSTPGFPVHLQIPDLTQTHVHWVGNAIQSSHHLSSPYPPAFNLSQHQGLFKWGWSSHQVAKVLEFQLQHQSFQWIFRTDFL